MAEQNVPDTRVGVALVRRPGPRVADGLVENWERKAVDRNLALNQWQGYVDTLRGAGWRTVEVATADDCPDAVFVEDSVVMVGDLAVLSAPARESRQGEIDGTRASVGALGLATTSVVAPGTLEGGDVLKVGDTLYVGLSSRTNRDGAAALERAAASRGRRVVPVPVTRVLHLKTAVTALPDGTVIGYEPFVDDPSVFPAFLPVPEPEGCAVLLIGGDRLLISAAAPRTAELLVGRGWAVTTVDIGELEKLEGCVTCLSVRIRHLPGAAA